MEFYYDPEDEHVHYKCPHMWDFGTLPNGKSNGWVILSIDPLTVQPSILNQPCGCHGFITNGAWVAV